MAEPRPRCKETTRKGTMCARVLQMNGDCDREYWHQQADTHEPPAYPERGLEWSHDGQYPFSDSAVD